MRPWATKQQKDWLTSRLKDYTLSKSNKTAAKFWENTFEDWFREWPEENDENGLSRDEGIKRRKMVSASVC
jgi:hypothetical protein